MAAYSFLPKKPTLNIEIIKEKNELLRQNKRIVFGAASIFEFVVHVARQFSACIRMGHVVDN